MLPNEFLERVFQRAPGGPVNDYYFKSWQVPGKPTGEALGVLPVKGLDPERLVQRVLDLDHYQGNVEHVIASRVIPDPRFAAPRLRFYQKIQIPVLGKIHQELVIEDAGELQGWRVVHWQMLDAETAALSGKEAARGQYCWGAWLAQPGVVGYAISSAPRREDVGLLKFKALTKGADLGAAAVIRGNIQAMARWSLR